MSSLILKSVFSTHFFLFQPLTQGTIRATWKPFIIIIIIICYYVNCIVLKYLYFVINKLPGDSKSHRILMLFLDDVSAPDSVTILINNSQI